jgi:hypothetical protein
VLRLPRPEDFEPLLAPLREFARVSPALVVALRELLVQTARPLSVASVDRVRVGEALGRVEAAREAVRRALADLPRESHYAPVAAQLRALASVSPSLMDWLKEVPRLTTPLSESIDALARALEDLETARDLLTEDAATPAPTPTGR